MRKQCDCRHSARLGSSHVPNFTHAIAGLDGDWTMAAYRDEQIAPLFRPLVAIGRCSFAEKWRPYLTQT